ncbi:MAG: beta-N-acetylhexosaminidase [Clostridiaceae bacterium]|nr:beta-N-acetylhexosaminidase [Clostridiaceae bacterium]
MYKLCFTGTACSDELLKGIEQFTGYFDFTICKDGLLVELLHTDKELFVRKNENSAVIGFSRKIEFFRALGLLFQHMEKPFINISEESKSDLLGVMIDNSRNGVLNLKSIKKLLRYMALMGLNTLMLYTEDTYELENYPYFGYMRGRFTEEELKESEKYAEIFGIEIVPCIQTLAHLNAALRWNAFAEYRDVNDILIAGEEKTYELIDAMLKFMSKSLKSRKINIGMDEAEMIGLGRYLEKNGYHNRTDIMLNHLKRVTELCNKYGYEPMMWSDMFFKLATSGSYYGGESLPKEVTERIPKEITLIYWDYYNTDSKKVSNVLDQHLSSNNPVVFAGGAWRWKGFTPMIGFSLLNSRVILDQCNKKGINNMFITAWGDDGAECSVFTILPILQLFAENSYAKNISDSHLDERLKTCAGIALEDYLLLDLPNQVEGNEKPGGCGLNPSKYLLYQDILLGIFDKHVIEDVFSSQYSKFSKLLKEAAERNPRYKNLFMIQAHLCDILELKCDMGIKLKKAYDSKDHTVLKILANKMDELLGRVAVFYEDVRSMWMEENKSFGFEVLSLRFGGLKQRIIEAKRRVEDYLEGRIEKIEELEAERLFFDGRKDAGQNLHLDMNHWDKIVSPNNIIF